MTGRIGGCLCCCGCTCGALWPQDELIREEMEAQDILVISVGGNDIALAPSILTIVMVALLICTPHCLLVSCHPAVL